MAEYRFRILGSLSHNIARPIDFSRYVNPPPPPRVGIKLHSLSEGENPFPIFDEIEILIASPYRLWIIRAAITNSREQPFPFPLLSCSLTQVRPFLPSLSSLFLLSLHLILREQRDNVLRDREKLSEELNLEAIGACTLSASTNRETEKPAEHGKSVDDGGKRNRGEGGGEEKRREEEGGGREGIGERNEEGERRRGRRGYGCTRWSW